MTSASGRLAEARQVRRSSYREIIARKTYNDEQYVQLADYSHSSSPTKGFGSEPGSSFDIST
jgi:hypothetical protein